MSEVKDVRADDALVRWWYNGAHRISRYFSVTLHDVAHVPAQGPVLLVGNHALLGIDAWALLPELYHATGRLPRPLGLRSLFDNPVLGRVLRELGGERGERGCAVELLERGELVIVYPGGSRDSLKGRSERYTLKWGERVGFAHVALESGATVIPVAGIGPDECVPVVSDRGLIPVPGMGGQGARVPLFVPIVRRVPFDFHFGEPLTPPRLSPQAPAAAREAAAQDFAAQVRAATEATIARGLAQRVEAPSTLRRGVRRVSRALGRTSGSTR